MKKRKKMQKPINQIKSNQIQYVSKSVRYQLRNLGFIRKYLNRSAIEKITHALISSRLDFGNGLLFSSPHNLLAKLQRLQNAAARVVTLSNKYSRITPVLKSLHWLPVEKRVVFKIILLLFHCILLLFHMAIISHGSAPQYNIGLIKHYFPSRQLRSQNSGLLVTPRVKTRWGGGEPSLMLGLHYGILSLNGLRIAVLLKC